MISALLNVENLNYNNDSYDKAYLNLDNLIKQLIGFIDYAVKFKEAEDNKSILIAIQWLCKMIQLSRKNDENSSRSYIKL